MKNSRYAKYTHIILIMGECVCVCMYADGICIEENRVCKVKRNNKKTAAYNTHSSESLKNKLNLYQIIPDENGVWDILINMRLCL